MEGRREVIELLNIDGKSLLDIAHKAQCLFVDPPYSKLVHGNTVSVVKKKGEMKGRVKRDLGFESLSPDLMDAIARMSSKVETWSAIFSDIETVGSWVSLCESYGATYIRSIPWTRWSMPQLSGDRPPQGCEMLMLFYGTRKGRKKYKGPGNLIQFNNKKVSGPNNGEKHPAEKPLDLCLEIVDYFSQEGDLILDPCAGKGTFGLASRILGRQYLGAENDLRWYEKAKDRIAKDLSDKDQNRAERYVKQRYKDNG